MRRRFVVAGMSNLSEIIAFLRLAKGGLAPETLAKAIRRRWPEATDDQIREAIERSATEEPTDAEEQVALEAAASAILKG